MTFDLASPQVLALVVLVAAVSGGRVLSGQRLCLGGARPACYKMAYFHHVSSRVDFWEAELACRVDGGHLVSIRTPQEQKHIQTLLEKLRLGSGISDGDFWIGLRRADDDDDERHPSDGVAPCPQRYRWTDGSAAAFREWHSDEPSCGAESCVVMYHQPGVGGAYLYQWNDDRCSMKHNFICKYQPERHPEEERGTTAAGRGAETTPDGNHVTLTGTSGPLALYVLLPAIPLLLILAAAAARYCRAPGKSPAARQGHLWISKTHKGGGAEP
ncbi:chondrolectin isoform X1 [Hippocampus comes]|uniref:chondrolectin isoform X1 n=1 Tax=Hippocampus comes TaxID=109280 RepID=UPI00094EE079|nr:PREDICTED: chondrolectin-like isoform X1 [Hippocampus comes]